jgi:hypothetical protein
MTWTDDLDNEGGTSHLNLKDRIALCLIIFIMPVLLASSAYSYTGPNRTTTKTVWAGSVLGETCIYDGTWHYVVTASYNCSQPGEPWKADYPDYYYACGPARNGNRVYENGCYQTTVTVTKPPATVSGSTGCTTNGTNGWCRSGAALSLSANEPVSGYVITGIESTLGKLCSTSSASPACAWNFPEGNTSLTYWSLSSYGDTSLQASASLKVDSVSPSVSLSIPTPNGSNGWFNSGAVAASASATDATSGIASVSINGGGSTFTVSADGVYPLTALATDNAGNTSTTNGTVQLDTEQPSLFIAAPAPNGLNGWYVSAFNASPAGLDATSGIASQSVSLDGVTWSGSVNVATEGTYAIRAQATDNAGNASTTTQAVKLDATPPSLSVTVPSPDGLNGWYVTAPSLSVTVNDVTSGVNKTEYSVDGGGGLSSIPALFDGIHNIQVRATDNAGNTSTNTQTVKLDIEQPSLSIAIPAPDGSNGWYVSAFTASPIGIDATSGIASQRVSLDGATWSSSVSVAIDGTYTIRARAIDNAGNTSTTTQTVKLDVTPPSLSITIPSPDGLNGWYVTAPTISVTASDAISGMDKTEYSVDSGAWLSSMPALSDGAHSIQARATDNAGNISTATQIIKIDTVSPSLSISVPAPDGSNGWYVSTFTASPAGFDATSGIASQSVSLDGATWLSSVNVATDGTYTIYARATDNAGNASTTTITVKIDTTAPSLSVNVPTPDGLNGWFVTTPTLSIVKSDAISGINKTEYSLDGGIWIASAPALSDGTHSIQVRVTDNAGNISTATQVVKIDTVSPSLSITAPTPTGSNGWFVTAPILSVVDSDATSGIFKTEYSVDGGGWLSSMPALSDGMHTILLRVTDNAGNVSTATQVVKIDTVSPILSISAPTPDGSNGWHVSAFTASPAGWDATSGIATQSVSFDGLTWFNSLGVVADGTYTIHARAIDNAGNVSKTTAAVKIDTTLPLSQFTSPIEGASVIVNGTYVMSGQSNDATAGVASAEMSLNGGATWSPIALNSGNWMVSWNTYGVPNGTYIILVRATDNAGLQELTAKIYVTVANAPPGIGIPAQWTYWQTIPVALRRGSFPVTGVRITISDPSGRWPAMITEYTAGDLPSEYKWSGMFGDGTMAPAGSYDAVAEAWDDLGNRGVSRGVVVIPLVPLATPTPIVPTAQVITETISTPVPPPAVIDVAPAQIEPVQQPVLPVPEPPKATAAEIQIILWPTLAFMGLLMVLGSSSLSDRRPQELRAIAHIMDQARENLTKYEQQ